MISKTGKDRIGRWCRLAVPALVLGAVTPLLVSARPPEVEVIPDAETRQVRYCFAGNDCSVCWDVYDAEPNRGIARSRTACSKPLEAQQQALSAVLETILNHHSGQTPLHTLFWGRLVPDSPQDDLQMARRLALAAYRSPAWDIQRGRATGGHDTVAVRDLANQSMIYPELKSLFASMGRRIRVSSVEKVLVLPAAQLPFFDDLASQGVQKTDRLPYDCLIWFDIELVK